ncbi:hypothetical protein ACLKA6_003738 [Drosophila palustris]
MSALEASAPLASQTTDEASTHDYIELKTMQDVEALEQKQLYSYIEKLHGIIRKYDTKIAIYKKKLRNFLNQESKRVKEKESEALRSAVKEQNNEEEEEEASKEREYTTKSF